MASHILRKIQSRVAGLCQDKVVRTDIDCLTLYKSERKTDPVLFVYEPRIYIVVQGSKQVSLYDRIYDYNERQYLVSTVDLPVSGMITEASPDKPYLAACISFSPLEILEVIETCGAEAMPHPASRSGMGLSALTDDLLDTVMRLLNCLSSKQDIHFLAPLIKKEIIYRMLAGEQGKTLYDIANDRSDLSGVNRAIAFLRQGFTENGDMTILPSLAGMSRSRFYKKFQQATNLTPLQYRLRLRMQEARRMLLHDAMSVAEIGFRVGYESPSQFNREYRKVFGLPPHADMKRIRTIGIDRYKDENEAIWR
ncbi:MAG: AraC family transcriptional regulator [Acetobacter aceti]|uniref:AraC family transcriptional regulator n=1 Tax=Acetobacter aceti TaxID=435 RepID=A0A1U9KHE0_ACEAC|nr:AraC family transcriptional regulator [Acetobacter aceti]AQS85225.1 AraC family transcriptional regulator [Acetobacter aceti]